MFLEGDTLAPKKMQKHSLIRTIYLYTFSLVGLVLVIIGGVRFIDMGLKAFVFTKADEEQRSFSKQPPFAPVPLEKLEPASQPGQTATLTLTENEKEQVRQWLTANKNWEEQQSQIDPVTSQRHRDASFNLAMILIGLPLFLYHWGVIKKEIKNSDAA